MPKRDRKALQDTSPDTTDESTTAPEQDYYNRLLHQCRKDLSKQLKICKSFECQKLIRKIKSLDEENNEKSDARQQQQQQAYDTVKQLSLEPVLDEACRRLGILQLNPSGYEPPQHAADASDSIRWTEKLLQHKRMQQSMEKWSVQATEFRKWCLKRQEMDTGHDTKRQTKQDKTRKQESKPVSDHGDVESSLFVQLGGGGGDNPNDPLLAHPTAKKNRPGQRARKAKAAAIQAKEKGLPAPEKSLNWRESKPATDTGGRVEPSSHKTHAVAMYRSGESQEQQGNSNSAKLHPSWEAQKSKKDGIVAFQGKKFTFD